MLINNQRIEMAQLPTADAAIINSLATEGLRNILLLEPKSVAITFGKNGVINPDECTIYYDSRKKDFVVRVESADAIISNFPDFSQIESLQGYLAIIDKLINVFLYGTTKLDPGESAHYSISYVGLSRSIVSLVNQEISVGFAIEDTWSNDEATVTKQIIPNTFCVYDLSTQIYIYAQTPLTLATEIL